MKNVLGGGTKLARGEDVARELVMDGPRVHTLDADRSSTGTRNQRHAGQEDQKPCQATPVQSKSPQ